MRTKYNPQGSLDLSNSHLKITQEYYAKYEAVSSILDEAPELLEEAHQDLKKALQRVNRKGGQGRRYLYTSENVLRILVCQVLEGDSLRGIVVRIDDSECLRRFVRIDHGPMMDFTTLCKLKNAIRPESWEAINRHLALLAVRQERIKGDKLRLDTTAVETNVHYPTDSSLLWDTYRGFARTIEKARAMAPAAVGTGRLQTRRAKRLQQKIARVSASKRGAAERLKPLYKRLIRLVENVSQWARSVRDELAKGTYGGSMIDLAVIEGIVQEIEHILPLGARVVDQARRRVLHGERVPNEEKIFSLAEPHTELLVRGKAGKPVEFGHMIQIQQVGGKFITDYRVFPKRPAEPALIDAALENHRELFGTHPSTLATDKGYYESMDAIDKLQEKVAVVSIAKKGRRTEEQTEREHDPLFRHAQRFRAGVEGTISFLKRILRMARCFHKGWEHFVSTVGQTVFAHNLLNLARC
ncbi:MAG: ISNCY family transposase [Gemmatimonadales bacterium]